MPPYLPVRKRPAIKSRCKKKPFHCNSTVGLQKPPQCQTGKHFFACWGSAPLILEICGGLWGWAGSAHTDSPGPLCPPRQVPWLKQSRSPLPPHARSRPGLCHMYKVSCGCWPTSQRSPVCENALSSVDRPLRGFTWIRTGSSFRGSRVPGVQVYRASVSPNR